MHPRVLLAVALFFVATLSPASANSYVYTPLKVPQPEDIVGFTMGEPLATGAVIRKTKADLVDFLHHAKTISM